MGTPSAPDARPAPRPGDRGKDLVFVVALLAAAIHGTWLLARQHFEVGAGWSDGETLVAPDGGEVRHSVWEGIEPLGPAFAGIDSEREPTLSPDGRLLVFAVGEEGENVDLWAAPREGAGFGEPRPLHGLNSLEDDLAPAFGPTALWFASDRGGSAFGFDLWRVPYLDGEFGEPEAVGGGINTAANERDPAPHPLEPRLVFSSDRRSGGRRGHELYAASVAPGNDADVRHLEELGGPGEERHPAFGPGGDVLWFASDRGPRPRDFDLWRAFPDDGSWLPPEPLGTLNSARDEGGPAVTDGGFGLLFSRRGPDGSTDLWRATSRELFRLPPAPVSLQEWVLLASLLSLALLALLAKRWDALDILYKCFLVSLLVHLLLLAYLQTLHPEAEPAPLRDPGATFEVRLAPSLTRAEENSDAGGGARAAAAPVRLAAVGLTAPAPATPAARSLPQAPSSQAYRPARVDLAQGDRAAAERARDVPRVAPRGPEAPAPLPVAVTPGVEVPRPEQSARPGRERRSDGPRRAPETGVERLVAPPLDPAERTVTASLPEGDARTPERTEPRRGAGSSSTATREPALPQTPEALVEAAAVPGATAGPGPSAPAPRERTAPTSTGPVRRTASPDLTPAAAAAPTPAARSLPTVAQGPTDPTPRPAPRSTRRATRGAPTAPRLPTAEASEARPSGVEPVVAGTLSATAPRTRVRAPSQGPRRAPTPSTASLAPDRASAPRARDLPGLAPRLPERRRLSRRPPQLEREAASPYQSRFGSRKELALRRHGGGTDTEAAVARGLAYLASIQRPNGAFGTRRDRDAKYGDVRIGKTALALLAFLGAGHLPGGDGIHSRHASAAVDFLLAEQKPNGHFGEGSSYGHGIATYALAEGFALGGQERLRVALDRGLGRILEQQVRHRDPERDGGWGYFFHDDHVWSNDRWPRVSVSSWQVMALVSARLAGLEIPDDALGRARSFLRRSWDGRRGWFRYSQDPARLRSGYPTLPASTPAALFALSLLGVETGQGELARGHGFVLERAPREFRYRGDDAFVSQARGNLYFWYYGTLSSFRLGGDGWARWNTALKEVLLPAQERDGSWRSISIYGRYAGDEEDERAYSTALCVLSLEVYYRYFTPLLEAR